MGWLTRLDQKVERWRGERAASAEGSESSSTDVGAMLPLLLGAALLSAALVLLVLRYSGMGSPPITTFDVIKLANAQRAVASKFIVGDKAAEEAGPLLLEVSKRTRQVIAEVAGPGALVVLRQAVVQGEVRDITDEVLTRLNLPTDVPTADPTRLAIDIAPTMLGAGPRIQVPNADEQSATRNDKLP